MFAVRDRTCIVTGVSPGGIGLRTAAALAAEGATVVLASRNEERAAAAMAEIRAMPAVVAGGGRVEYMHLDLNDLRNVEGFVRAFKARHDNLAVLVNNAGLNSMDNPTARTANGLVKSYGVNFVAAFHLTNLLLPTLRASAPSRVVNVSSQMHRSAAVERMDIAATACHTSSYSNSKLAMIWHTNTIQRRMEADGVDVKAISVTPGAVRTNIWRTLHGVAACVLKAASQVLFLSPEQGAATSVRAALDPSLRGGEYLSPYKAAGRFPALDYCWLFGGAHVIPASPAAYAPAAEDKHWAATERLIEETIRE